MELIPSVQTLWLNHMVVPATFLANLTSLKALRLFNFYLAPETNASRIPEFAGFPSIITDFDSLKRIQLFYQQPLPAYVNLSVLFTTKDVGNIQLDDILGGSADSLQKLAIRTRYKLSANIIFLNFNKFKMLSEFRVLYTCFTLNPNVARVLKESLSAAATLSSSSSSPSNLTSFQIEIAMAATLPEQGDLKENLSSTPRLDRKDLFKRHPKLKSIVVKIIPPKLERRGGANSKDDADHALSVKKLIKRCMKKLLPNSLRFTCNNSNPTSFYSDI
ncbi:hypothetical protein CPB83DRAFT_861503 [Crepidotus variabilis]|uniref:Uncharacterized protein n=1 Tax=Crepidotus variabilis TaxID=179855 RepID=A0A9P6E8C5_9AGAR|nr:hypothetical protein CPB83DRAFT_861503 [Crepidotus variabilis]